MPQINLKHAATFVDGLDHPEGVALGPDGKVYAGGEGGQVYRIDYASRHVETYADTGGQSIHVHPWPKLCFQGNTRRRGHPVQCRDRGTCYGHPQLPRL
jgi:hypothetical protein